MRSYSAATVCFFVVHSLTGAVRAEDPRAVLDRAIGAHGGAARLERTKKGHLKAKIEATQLNAPFTYEIEEWFDLPERYKQIALFNSSGTPFRHELAYDGNDGWSREGTKPVHIERRESSSLVERWYAIMAVLLLLQDKDSQLTALPDQTKDGRMVAGIHAVYSNLSGDYFFDKSTGLLQRSKTIEPNAQENVEIFYDDYRDVQGIRYPMRFKVEGKKVSSTVTLSSIEFRDKIDESVFANPQPPSGEGAVHSGERTPEHRNGVLIIVTVVAGIVIGAVWFIVRASKRGKQEMPPS